MKTHFQSGLTWISLFLFDALNLFTLLCGYRSGRTVCLKKVSFFSFVFIFLQKNKTKEKKTSDYPNKEHLQASSNKIPGSS